MPKELSTASVTKNFGYNIAYQVLAIVLPFITAPYLSRVLGAEGVGVYSYTNSVASYFLLFTMLGMANHGNRTIAASSKDRVSLGHSFVNNYIIQATCGIVVTALYIAYCIMLDANRLVAFVQTFVVLSGVFDISWLYFGLEEFKITVIRNAACKFAGVIAIFAFVSSPDDTWIYALIMALTTLWSQVILWGFLRQRIRLFKPEWHEVKQNIKPVLVMFIPVLSYSIYMILDKIMIGQLAGMEQLGYFSNAEKIMNIPTSIVAALGTVMLPRATSVLSQGDVRGHQRYMRISFLFVTVIEGFICFGISSIATLFAPWYFGSEFYESGVILKAIILAPLFSGYASVIRTQLLIPKFKDSVYVSSTVLAAVSNCCFNLVLIPVFRARGAVVGTLAAEVVALLYQAFSVRGELPWRQIGRENASYLVVAGMAYLLVTVLNVFLPVGGLCLMLTGILIGGSFYGISLLLIARVREDYLYRLIRELAKNWAWIRPIRGSWQKRRR